MNLDKSRISKVQFIFIIACFIQASTLLSSFISRLTYHESWIPIVLSSIIMILVIIIFKKLIYRFDKKNLIEIINEVCGPILGKILSFIYLWFFILITGFNLMDLVNLIKQTVMSKTPVVFIVVVIIIVSGWGVRNGVKIIGRYSGMFAIISIVVTIMSVLLLKNQIDVLRFLPLFTLSGKKYFQSTHILTSIPFGELIAVFMIIPNVNASKKELSKAIFIGFIIGALTFLVVVLRDISVLGNTYSLYNSPPLFSYRLIDVTETLGRAEIAFVFMLILFLVFKVMVLYYASVMCITTIFKLDDYKPIVGVTGAFIASYSLILIPNPIVHMKTTLETTVFVWTFIEIIIPTLLLITSFFQKLVPKETKT